MSARTYSRAVVSSYTFFQSRLVGRSCKKIVGDTAPTGHLLNLLRTPDMAQRWLSFLVSIIGRYNQNGSMGGLEQGVMELRRSVEKLHATLSDVESTATIAVAAAEPMGVLELERFLEGLRDLGMGCRHIVFNRLIQPAPCAFCETRRQQEIEQMRAFISWSRSGWRKHADWQITGVPLATREFRGVAELTALENGCSSPR
ncbi:MAG: ArsA family ATPase [Candidatus Xenobia bacterium]